MVWSGIGVNYGHQVTISSYDTSQVESDFIFLRANGINKIRIAMPGFDESVAMIAHCQDMVIRALAHGFYVVWGVVAGFGAGSLTATRWALAKSYITGTLAPWAQSVGLSELCLTNESELSSDGITLTNATIRADIRTLASTVKSGGFLGNVSYSTSVSSIYLNSWISDGIGVLDKIGFNSYDTITNFNNSARQVFSSFSTKGYISEFGSINNGYPDFNDEIKFHHDTIDRVVSMQNNSVASGYFFTYRDGGGISANTFALIQTSNVSRLALQAVLGVATPFYGKFMVHG